MESRDNYEYVDEKSIHEDLLCSLCTDPFDEPLCANQCGHTFCRQCITKTFDMMSQCPTCRESLQLEDFHPVNIRPFLNQLNQLLVKCKMCSTANIQRGNFKDHLTKCGGVKMLCPAAELNCHWTGQRNQLEDHVQTCSLMKVQLKMTKLNTLVEQQSKQIRFLHAILENLSGHYKETCAEGYTKTDSVCCDVCDKEFVHAKHGRALHFCPQTDICSNCVKDHFSSK